MIEKVREFVIENKKNILIAGISWKILATLLFLQYKSCTEVEVLPPKQLDKTQTIAIDTEIEYK